MVRIDITDHGLGIPENEIDRIFDPYFTSRRNGQGSGLGLFAVKRLVTDWGGKIDVRSTVNEGSTFSLFIPARSGEISNV
jgi:signal transduction histidine kinase